MRYRMKEERNTREMHRIMITFIRWQDYTENYTKKVLMTWITMMVWSLT